MADPIAGVSVVVDEPDNSVRVDPVTGTIEQDQPDGGVVVQLDARRPKADGEPDDFYRNLADDIDQSLLGTITNDLFDAIQADHNSRGEYLSIRARGLQLLGTTLQEPRANVGDTSASVEGMATVTNPLLLEACLKGWANAQAELLPSQGPVKVKIKGDETKGEDDLAESFERDLNYWFTNTAAEYYPDTSHMLLWGVYVGGSGFKKIYRCPMRRRPVSESINTENFIVSDTTKDLRSCGRITHEILMRPSVMKRMKFIGAYRDVTLTQPSPTVNEVQAEKAAMQGTASVIPQRPEDQPYTIWETQCELDIPQYAPKKFKGEGIPLPYLVTVDKDSREILAIRRDWREEDEDCERKRMYVRYPYVPGPGFYGTGMLNILGNASAAMTAAWREALDAGMFANFPSFLISKLAGRQNTSDFRMGAGTAAPIETGGQPIGNVVANLPYRDVTPGLLALIDKITSQAQGLGSSADIPTSEGVQNVPVGTMLAQIEQATKVTAAAHKGMHQAQAEEINMIVDLFRDNPEDFWKNNKECPKDYWSVEKFTQAMNDCNLVPASDPNTPSHIHRIAKGAALAQLIGVPQFTAIMDPKETLTRIFAAMKEDPAGLIIDAPAQPQQPDPQAIAAQAKMQQAQTAQFKAASDAQATQQQGDIKMQELNTQRDIATVDLAKEAVIHGDNQNVAVRSHGLDVSKHALDIASARHDAAMDVAQHGLDVHQALNPPLPKAPV